MNSPSILIVGAGALGCLFAARLNQAGCPVHLLEDWPPAVAHLQKNGVRLLDESDQPLAARPLVFTSTSALPRVEFALILVKAWQTLDYAKILNAKRPAAQGYLTLQNGLGNLESLLENLPGERCAAGTCLTGAAAEAPGVVRQSGPGRLTLPDDPWLMPLAAALESAGFQVDRSPQVAGLLWQKAVINAAINPLTALLKITNGQLLERPALIDAITRIAAEGAAVAAAAGVTLPDGDLPELIQEVCRATASNRSSMLQDLENGRQTEIEAINGHLVRVGQSHGVDVHYNRLLWQLIRAAAQYA